MIKGKDIFLFYLIKTLSITSMSMEFLFEFDDNYKYYVY